MEVRFTAKVAKQYRIHVPKVVAEAHGLREGDIVEVALKVLRKAKGGGGEC